MEKGQFIEFDFFELNKLFGRFLVGRWFHKPLTYELIGETNTSYIFKRTDLKTTMRIRKDQFDQLQCSPLYSSFSKILTDDDVVKRLLQDQLGEN